MNKVFAMFRSQSYNVFRLLLIMAAISLLGACRGYFSEKPPIDLVPNLDVQPKHTAQSEGSAKPPVGVVPQGALGEAEDADFLHGIRIGGNYLPVDDVSAFADASINQQPLPLGITYLPTIPVEVDGQMVMRGMERFNIYCAVCHAQTGTGDSIIMRRGVGFPRPPDLSSETVIAMRDGELFNVITHGRRNMSGYALQIPVEDRWAIVSYIRALQYSRTGTLADVPEARRGALIAEIDLALEEVENTSENTDSVDADAGSADDTDNDAAPSAEEAGDGDG